MSDKQSLLRIHLGPTTVRMVRSLEPHRAWVDDVVEVVENGRGHLRQEHYLRYLEDNMTSEAFISAISQEQTHHM